MSLEQAVRNYLRFIDRERGDDYFTAERRAVRVPLDNALDAYDVEGRDLARIRAAAVALVMKRFDWYFDNNDEDEQRELDPFWSTLLAELGMTEEQIAAPGRAVSEQREAAHRAEREAEHTRRRALTQEERDAEDAARWKAMDPMEQHLFVTQMAMYGACNFEPRGSLDATFGSSKRWSNIPQAFAVYGGSIGKPWNEAPFSPTVIIPGGLEGRDVAITNIHAAPETPKARAIRVSIADTGEVLWELPAEVARVSVPKDGVAVAEFTGRMPSSDYQVTILPMPTDPMDDE